MPSDEEFLAFGAQFLGCGATGAPPMPAEWVAGVLADLHGRRAFPTRWQAVLVNRWRSEFRGWLAKKPGEKTGRLMSWQGEAMAAERRRRELVEGRGSRVEGSDGDRAVRAELRECEGVLRSIPKDASEEWARALRREAFERACAEHPGNPASTAYDEVTVTEGQRAEFAQMQRQK